MRKIFHISFAFLLSALVLGVVLSTPTLAATTDTPDIIVPAAQGPSVSTQLMKRTQSTWPWYITRASGLVAAAALVILILSGVGFITGRSFAFLEPLTAWATHRAIGIVFAVAVSIHSSRSYLTPMRRLVLSRYCCRLRLHTIPSRFSA